MKSANFAPKNLSVDVQKEPGKEFGENWKRVGKFRLDSTLECLNKIGIENLKPFSGLLGQIRESDFNQLIFTHEVSGNLQVEGVTEKTVVTVLVEFIVRPIAQPIESPVGSSPIICSFCGKPVIQKVQRYTLQYHKQCRYANLSAQRKTLTIQKLFSGICDHFIRGKKGVFPCESCKSLAKKYNFNLRETA
jgi:hypothetical protein